ncbi:hypothetical protein [Paenibacillus sp. SI8]|uniref:hypothetical protein n=1 Tax=unclassified Paenibacillus TaxID=185978 RepID=UPI003465E923
MSNMGVGNVKVQGSNIRENPYGSLHGQEVVSIQESFQARLAREARPRCTVLEGYDFSANLNQQYYFLTHPSPIDEIAYVQATVSANVDCELIILVDHGLKSVNKFYKVAFCKAGTPLEIQLDGSIFMYEGGTVKLGINSATAGKAWGSVVSYDLALPN